MVPTSRFSRSPKASVLIVYVNSTMGVALADRLFDGAQVSLAPVAEALDSLQGGSRHDVVVFCPYLAAEESAALLAACDAREPVPAVVQVADAAATPGAHVRILRASAHDAAPVLAGLALPVAA